MNIGNLDSLAWSLTEPNKGQINVGILNLDFLVEILNFVDILFEVKYHFGSQLDLEFGMTAILLCVLKY